MEVGGKRRSRPDGVAFGNGGFKKSKQGSFIFIIFILFSFSFSSWQLRWFNSWLLYLFLFGSLEEDGTVYKNTTNNYFVWRPFLGEIRNGCIFFLSHCHSSCSLARRIDFSDYYRVLVFAFTDVWPCEIYVYLLFVLPFDWYGAESLLDTDAVQLFYFVWVVVSMNDN